jgi:Transmembrane protein of unknown function (DUF3556)
LVGLLDPVPPPYDPLEWDHLPFGDKVRQVCQAWAVQGYGTPPAVFLVYLAKVAFYLGMWSWFCGFSPGLGGLDRLDAWWSEPVAFQKAIVWSMLFEGLGLGCGSGPLTGRYLPPVGGFLYYLRPGTTKLPLAAGWPLVGGDRRTWLDVLLYAALVAALVTILVSPSIETPMLLTVVGLVLVASLGDKTIFLMTRSEHYLITIACFASTTHWIAGAKLVALALWFFAGVSKLNHHFPAVVCVMTSNSPVLRMRWLRERMYRNYPDDLRPSRLAEVMAHVGTALELGVPILLAFGRGGSVTLVGLVLMVALHGFITSNVPMGVPIEWNVMVVYAGFFLFGVHADVAPWAIDSLPLAGLLVVMLLVVPIAGNLWPSRISFLLAMRYYAGNWANSVWLFEGKSYEKLDRLTKSAPWIFDQLAHFYDEGTGLGLVGKVIAFRAMHLHGRAYPELVPRAVDRFEDYLWLDGELVAGLVLGWNFGDGHLHDEQLLGALQRQCDFEPGELRCVFVESQPLFGSTLAYRIVDAATGVIEAGELEVAELRERQPWPS